MEEAQGDREARTRHRSMIVGLLNLRVAGAERIALELVQRLGDEYRIEIASVLPTSRRPPLLPEDTPVAGLLTLLFKRADIIHTYLFLPGLFARIQRFWDRRTVWVHTVHYHNYEAVRLGGVKRWLDHRFVFPATDELVAVSEEVAESLSLHLNLQTILNAIPLEASEPRKGPAGPAPVVGTVAMFRPEKDLESLVQAAVLLRDRLPGIRIRIAGDGPLRAKLDGMIRSLGVEEQVELCGYVQPSFNEPFGLAVLDAFRFGLPVVAARAGYLPTLLEKGAFGILVQRSSDFPEELAEAVVSAGSARSEWIDRSRKGIEHWRMHISTDRMVSGYRTVFSRLLSPAVAVIAPVVTDGGGGLQRQVEIQTRALAAGGCQIYLLQRWDAALFQDASLRNRWRHVRFLLAPTPLRTPAPGSLAERFWGGRFILSGLRLLFRHRSRIGILHVHQLYSPTLLGALAKSFLSAPLLAKVTASGELGEAAALKHLPFRGLRRWALGRVDRFLVLSAGMGEEVKEMGIDPERITILPNAVRIPEFPVMYPFGYVSSERPPLRVVFTGRFSSEKSLETLLDAAAMGPWAKGLKVILVGEGEPRRNVEPELRRRAEMLPPQVSVTFTGPVPDVDLYLREADVFVLPSRSEGMSNALLEAMAMGLACVASDIEPNRGLIEDGSYGLLFPPEDASALYAALRRLDEDGEKRWVMARRLGRAARERVRKEFSEDAIADRLEAIYRAVSSP